MVDMRTFQNFMQSMRGKDPNQILNHDFFRANITATVEPGANAGEANGKPIRGV
mgnify:CR=1 FL=1